MWTDEEIKDFYDNYRESLSKQYESSLQNIDQQRTNAQASIMSGANKAGMMYSNFPERSKIQYDVSTYIPAQVKAKNTYQTGLDSLRNNITNYKNSIVDLQEAINTLNSTYTNSGSGGGTGGSGGSGGGTGGDGGGDGDDGSTDDLSNGRTKVEPETKTDETENKLNFYPVTPQTWPKQYISERPAFMGGGYSYTIPGQGHINVEAGKTLVIKDGKYYTVRKYGSTYGDVRQVWPSYL